MRDTTKDKTPKRKRNWEKAEKVLTKSKSELIWIPLEYEEDIYQSYAFQGNQEVDIKKIRYLYQQPIIQGLIITKQNKNKMYGYVVKLAFDPVQMSFVKSEEFILDKFSGHIVRTSWEEDFEFALKYDKGKHSRTLTPLSKSKIGKIQACVSYPIYTDWWSQTTAGGYTGQPIYIYTSVNFVTVCDHPALDYSSHEPISLPPSYGGYPADATYVYTPPFVFPDPCDFLANPNGPNGTLAKNNVENVLNSFGTGFSVQSFTWDKAQATARALGGELMDTQIMNIGGKAIAGLSAVTSTGSFIVGITDGTGFTWSDDGKNGILTVLGFASLGLAFAASTPAVIASSLGVSAASLFITFIPNSVFGQSSPC